jgi:archaellum component FlaG (FlaF/FlaG flagellin family)
MPNEFELSKIPNHGCDSEDQKLGVTLTGVVREIVKPLTPSQPERVQIVIEGGGEIRIENTLETSTGKKVKLKPGDDVEVKIEVSPNSVVKETAA